MSSQGDNPSTPTCCTYRIYCPIADSCSKGHYLRGTIHARTHRKASCDPRYGYTWHIQVFLSYSFRRCQSHDCRIARHCNSSTCRHLMATTLYYFRWHASLPRAAGYSTLTLSCMSHSLGSTVHRLRIHLLQSWILPGRCKCTDLLDLNWTILGKHRTYTGCHEVVWACAY